METEQLPPATTAKPAAPALTKKGVPRKPYVMTEARKQAFEKCKKARQEKLQEKKEGPIDTNPPAPVEALDPKSELLDKKMKKYLLQKEKAKEQAKRIVESMASQEVVSEPMDVEEVEEGEVDEEVKEEAEDVNKWFTVVMGCSFLCF